MRCVLIGYGYWGKIIEPYILRSKEFDLIGICDHNYESTLNLDKILEKQLIQCAFVCVPVRAHFQIVKKLLQNKIHVFCEKPLCSDIEEMKLLFQLADENQVVLFTDYIYTVSPSLACIKRHLSDFGKIRYIDMQIKQFGRFYKYDDVFDIIGVHMISALLYLLDIPEGEMSVADIDIIARGRNQLPDAGILSFRVKQIRGKIECSLLSDIKERKINIFCEKGFIVFDMMSEVTVKLIAHYESHGQMFQNVTGQYRYDENNNLSAMLESFYQSIISGNHLNRQITEQVELILGQIKECYKSLME